MEGYVKNLAGEKKANLTMMHVWVKKNQLDEAIQMNCGFAD